MDWFKENSSNPLGIISTRDIWMSIDRLPDLFLHDLEVAMAAEESVLLDDGTNKPMAPIIHTQETERQMIWFMNEWMNVLDDRWLELIQYIRHECRFLLYIYIYNICINYKCRWSIWLKSFIKYNSNLYINHVGRVFTFDFCPRNQSINK